VVLSAARGYNTGSAMSLFFALDCISVSFAFFRSASATRADWPFSSGLRPTLELTATKSLSFQYDRKRVISLRTIPLPIPGFPISMQYLLGKHC